MVSTRSKRSSAQARHTVESWPPEKSTSAVSPISPTSIPLRRSGISVVDNAPVPVGKGANLRHLSVRQRKVKERKILRQAFDPAGARNDDDPLLHQIAQRDLRRALALGGTDAGKDRVLLGITASDRAIGNDRHAMRTASGDDLRLIEEGMHLDLVADERLG